MWSKISLTAIALMIAVSAAEADQKPAKPDWNGGGNWDGQNFKDGHEPRRDAYRYKHRHKHNNNNNEYFYQDPNFWGGVAGGLIGGAIIRQYNYNEVEPLPYYQQPAECFMAWTQVYIPGKGFVPYQTTVCP
jgi:hypothetical protein